MQPLRSMTRHGHSTTMQVQRRTRTIQGHSEIGGQEKLPWAAEGVPSPEEAIVITPVEGHQYRHPLRSERNRHQGGSPDHRAGALLQARNSWMNYIFSERLANRHVGKTIQRPHQLCLKILKGFYGITKISYQALRSDP